MRPLIALAFTLALLTLSQNYAPASEAIILAAVAPQPDAPAAVKEPIAAWVFVAMNRPLARSQSCAGGSCSQPEASPKRYSVRAERRGPVRLRGVVKGLFCR